MSIGDAVDVELDTSPANLTIQTGGVGSFGDSIWRVDGNFHWPIRRPTIPADVPVDQWTQQPKPKGVVHAWRNVRIDRPEADALLGVVERLLNHLCQGLDVELGQGRRHDDGRIVNLMRGWQCGSEKLESWILNLENQSMPTMVEK